MVMRMMSGFCATILGCSRWQAKTMSASRRWRTGNLACPDRHDCLSSTRLIRATAPATAGRSEEHTSELQSQSNLVCRLLLEKKKKKAKQSLIRQTVTDTKLLSSSQTHILAET